MEGRRTATYKDAALCTEATTSIVNIVAIIAGERDRRQPADGVAELADRIEASMRNAQAGRSGGLLAIHAGSLAAALAAGCAGEPARPQPERYDHQQ